MRAHHNLVGEAHEKKTAHGVPSRRRYSVSRHESHFGGVARRPSRLGTVRRMSADRPAPPVGIGHSNHDPSSSPAQCRPPKSRRSRRPYLERGGVSRGANGCSTTENRDAPNAVIERTEPVSKHSGTTAPRPITSTFVLTTSFDQPLGRKHSAAAARRGFGSSTIPSGAIVGQLSAPVGPAPPQPGGAGSRMGSSVSTCSTVVPPSSPSSSGAIVRPARRRARQGSPVHVRPGCRTAKKVRNDHPRPTPTPWGGQRQQLVLCRTYRLQPVLRAMSGHTGGPPGPPEARGRLVQRASNPDVDGEVRRCSSSRSAATRIVATCGRVMP